MNTELNDDILNLLKRKFDIVSSVDCRDFDMDYKLLDDILLPLSNKTFSNREKILFVHMDTDYYDNLLPVGLIPLNLIRAFKQFDIPLHSMLFVTNHFGIQKEFDLLLLKQHENDRPLIIETLLSKLLYPPVKDTPVPNIDFNKITKPALCMMGACRSHRVALYNFLMNDNLDTKVAVAQHFNNVSKK